MSTPEEKTIKLGLDCSFLYHRVHIPIFNLVETFTLSFLEIQQRISESLFLGGVSIFSSVYTRPVVSNFSGLLDRFCCVWTLKNGSVSVAAEECYGAGSSEGSCRFSPGGPWALVVQGIRSSQPLSWGPVVQPGIKYQRFLCSGFHLRGISSSCHFVI